MNTTGSKIKKNGFTIIELALVVIIIGLLISIAVPAFQAAKAQAQLTKKKEIISAVAQAKSRATINSSAKPANTYSTFNDLKNYLVVNGTQPNIELLTNGSTNGVGEDLTAWGLFPHANNSGLQGVLFRSDYLGQRLVTGDEALPYKP